MESDDIYKKFGELIRSHRDKMHLSQTELAQKVELSRASIANIEKGRQKIPLHHVYTFAKHLNIEPAALIPKLGITLKVETLHITLSEDKRWVDAILKKMNDD